MHPIRAKHYDVFVSYKREDDAVREMLCSGLHDAGFEPWWDAKLGQGDFRDQLRDEINRSDVVIALWSWNAHNQPDEVKMEMSHAFGVKKLLPVRLDDAPIPRQFRKENFLPFESWADPVSGPRQLDRILAEARKLGARPRLNNPQSTRPVIPVELGELPSAPSRLIGRSREMQMLRDSWNDPTTNAVVLHAFGGAGKSALLRAFVNERLEAGGDGASRIYGWSAYSQGSGDQKRADADGFLSRALADFGYAGPPIRDSVESGRTLARLVQQERVLMLLDGIEPLQDLPGPMKGRFKDKGLAAFIKALGAQNPGLMVLTSRQEVPELRGFGGLAIHHPLEDLTEDAGADLLVDLGVSGRNAELKKAVRDLNGHALSVTLLGTFLAEICGGDIRERERFDFGDIILTPQEQDNSDRTVTYAKRAEKVLEAYLDRFDALARSPGGIGGAERALLHLLGLFDRPADGAGLDMLLENPIEGLTDHLFIAVTEESSFLGLRKRRVARPLTAEERAARIREAKARLRKLRLVANADSGDPHGIDAHPVVRAFFAGRLKRRAPEAARAAHSRLFDHYSAAAPELPATLVDMQPLFFAVQHAVRSGQAQAALFDIYVKRIRRGDSFYMFRTLGAYGAALAVISNFFEAPWQRLDQHLSPDLHAFILGEASYALRALGRLRDSVGPREAALAAAIGEENWSFASNLGEMLSVTYLALGEVEQAISVAERALEHAKIADEGFRIECGLTILGNALSSAGRFESACACFDEAQARAGRDLLSLRGFLYGTSLLNLGAAEDALARGRRLTYFGSNGYSGGPVLLDIGLGHLLAGQALTALGDTEAGASIDLAVDTLRRASMADYLSMALLTRAAYLRRQAAAGDPDALARLREDLDEVADMADPEMRLHLTDLALERARLALEVPQAFDSPVEEAARQVGSAARLIAETGYHRRDRELADLQVRLAEPDPTEA